MKYLIIFFLLSTIIACDWSTPSSQNNKDKQTLPNINIEQDLTKKGLTAKWLCIPGQQVGNITKETSEAAIIGFYGQENVIRKTIGLGEGETAEVTVLFPDTQNELIVEWESTQAFKKPAKIRIEKNNTSWKTHQSISIGTTLKELEKINGKDFNFYGFEWDYAGLANDWQGGQISPQLTVFLEANNPNAIYPDLLGDTLFSSKFPKAVAADLSVRAMVVEL